MNIQDAVATCLAKYATFRGRASRSEFWWFWLASTLFGWFAIIAGNSLGREWGSFGILYIVLLSFFHSSLLVYGASMTRDEVVGGNYYGSLSSE
ncbi:DUF805 domain-containing protein [Xanthobacter sp. AM11]|uniref:DUF805 domain-containing protein n=1 Tax=Xanthobacter sp. AM11 TaxID=3380643 RepID=UPI0039BFB0B1